MGSRRRKGKKALADNVNSAPGHDRDATTEHTDAAVSKEKIIIKASAMLKNNDDKHTHSNGTTLLNGVSNGRSAHYHNENSEDDDDEISDIINIKQYTSRIRRQSLIVGEQMSKELAKNSGTNLKYGTYISILVAFLIIFPYYFTIILRPNLPPVIGGFVEPGFEYVAEVFKNLVESGEECGGTFSVTHKGKLVVNLWGGYADWRSEQPWSNYTVSKWFSVTKAMAAVVVAMLTDSGDLDYDEEITTYWPEFAKNGKENITVKHLMSHTAGLATVGDMFDIIPLIKDPEAASKMLEKQTPKWLPGSRVGYHALTWGLYLDQLVRRADWKHRSIKEFFHEEIAEPFGIDFYIGLPRHLQYRTAQLDSSNIPRTALRLLPAKYYRMAISYLLRPYSLMTRVATETRDILLPPLEKSNTPERRELAFASSHGYGTSEAVAKLFGILANEGRLGDMVLLSKNAIEMLSTPEFEGFDTIMHDKSTYAMGMKLYKRFEGTKKERYIFGHPGIGGQVGAADKQEGLGWGYVTNFFSVTGDADYPNYMILEEAMYKCHFNLQDHH